MSRWFNGTIALASVALLGLTGCSGSGDDDDDTEDFSLVGIWNADIRYETYNGQPYPYAGAYNFRFEKKGPGWSCLVNGVDAQQCDFDGTAVSFGLTQTREYDYVGYTRIRTSTFTGLHNPDEKTLETSFTIVNEWRFDEGGSEVSEYTGKATLVRVERFDETEASGLKKLGEYGAFDDSSVASFRADGRAARGAPLHEEHPGEAKFESGSATYATANVRVKGNYAYLARFSDGLRVLDISDPANIREAAFAPAEESGAGYLNDIKLFSTGGRDYAALSDADLGLVVYDVTSPTAPRLVSTYPSGLLESGGYLNNHTLFMEGTIAYLAVIRGSVYPFDDESGGLLIVDLSDPENPVELGSWLARDLGGSYVHDLYVEDGIAYLCSWEIGLVVLDVKTPWAPRVLGQYSYPRMTSHSVWVTEVNGRKVAVHGDEDFGSHVRVVDVDPESESFMSLISEFTLRPEVSVHNIMAVGSEAVAAYYQDGVRVIDLSDLENPRQVAFYNSWRGMDDDRNGLSFYEGGIGVDVVGNRIYLADIERGLIVLERE